MKIELRFTQRSADEVQFAVVVNDKECGQLSMSQADAVTFAKALRSGCMGTDATVCWTGDIDLPEDWVVWHKRSGKERRTLTDRRTCRERRGLEPTSEKP